MSQSSSLPVARDRKSLLVERVRDEVVVYDSETQQAHCLHATAAMVWDRCDGKTTVAEMIEILGVAGIAADGSVVAQALSELARANLVAPPAPPHRHTRHLASRRQALRTIGLATGAVLVQSLMPPPASACIASGQPAMGMCPTCCAGLGCTANLLICL